MRTRRPRSGKRGTGLKGSNRSITSGSIISTCAFSDARWPAIVRVTASVSPTFRFWSWRCVSIPVM